MKRYTATIKNWKDQRNCSYVKTKPFITVSLKNRHRFIFGKDNPSTNEQENMVAALLNICKYTRLKAA